MNKEVLEKFKGKEVEMEIKAEDYSKDKINNTFIVSGTLYLETTDYQEQVTIECENEAICTPASEVVRINLKHCGDKTETA